MWLLKLIFPRQNINARNWSSFWKKLRTPCFKVNKNRIKNFLDKLPHDIFSNLDEKEQQKKDEFVSKLTILADSNTNNNYFNTTIFANSSNNFHNEDYHIKSLKKDIEDIDKKLKRLIELQYLVTIRPNNSNTIEIKNVSISDQNMPFDELDNLPNLPLDISEKEQKRLDTDYKWFQQEFGLESESEQEYKEGLCSSLINSGFGDEISVKTEELLAETERFSQNSSLAEITATKTLLKKFHEVSIEDLCNGLKIDYEKALDEINKDRYTTFKKNISKKIHNISKKNHNSDKLCDKNSDKIITKLVLLSNSTLNEKFFEHNKLKYPKRSFILKNYCMLKVKDVKSDSDKSHNETVLINLMS